MFSKITAILTTSLLIIVLSNCSQGDKAVTLKYKYTKGQYLAYEQISKRHAKVTEADSMVKEEAMTMKASISQEVRELFDDGTAYIIERDVWEYEQASEKDSTKMEKREKVRELGLTVRPDGKILDIKFLTEENQIAVSYIKNYYEQGMPIFPSGEVSPGDSWTQTTTVVLPNETMEASTTYKVKAMVREAGYDCVVIESDGTVIIPIESTFDDTLTITGVDRTRSTGKLYFAYKEGLVVLQRERWVIDGRRHRKTPNKENDYNVSVEIDVEFALTERSKTQ